MQSITQRTPEWHEQRKLRMTGSRIGAILGDSPWQKPADIMRAMVREYHGAESEFAAQFVADHGNHNEQRALLAFMRETGLQVEPCGFFAYGDRMGASPDGLTSNGGVLELKVPYSLRKGGDFKPLAEQLHYEHQVQMEMLATGREHAYFAQYRAPHGDPLAHDYVPEAIKIERVKFDPKWIDRVLPELNEFYRQLLLELDNPAHLEPLRVQIDTPEAGALLSELDAIRESMKNAKEREAEIIKALVEMAGEKDAEVHGRKLTRVQRAGSISYAKAIRELLPDADLEPYRGEGSAFWRVT